MAIQNSSFIPRLIATLPTLQTTNLYLILWIKSDNIICVD